jgi:hypothetical protein
MSEIVSENGDFDEDVQYVDALSTGVLSVNETLENDELGEVGDYEENEHYEQIVVQEETVLDDKYETNEQLDETENVENLDENVFLNIEQLLEYSNEEASQILTPIPRRKPQQFFYRPPPHTHLRKMNFN